MRKHKGRGPDGVKVDAVSKIITDYEVTPASVHDSNVFLGFITNEDIHVYADSAYAHFATKFPESVTAHICEKGNRGATLTDAQKQSNRIKAKVRCRIEHVFGFMTGSMNGITVRSIGKKRPDCNVRLTNLVYNRCWYSVLKRRQLTVG